MVKKLIKVAGSMKCVTKYKFKEKIFPENGARTGVQLIPRVSRPDMRGK